MKIRMTLATAGGATLLLALTSTICVSEELTGHEVTTLISGKTLYSRGAVGDAPITYYFAPDGSVRQRKKEVTSRGSWRIDEESRLCIQLRDPFSRKIEKETCRLFVKEGGSIQTFGVKPDGTRVPSIRITRLADGNAENL